MLKYINDDVLNQENVKKQYEKAEKAFNTTCPVCQEEFKDGEKVVSSKC